MRLPWRAALYVQCLAAKECRGHPFVTFEPLATSKLLVVVRFNSQRNYHAVTIYRSHHYHSAFIGNIPPSKDSGGTKQPKTHRITRNNRRLPSQR